MFSTIDSQPQEWLLNNHALLHTLCFCCFENSAKARKWIHTLIPRNRNGSLLKWSTGGSARRVKKRRKQFVEALEHHYDSFDFTVHCISSTEGQISLFANALFLQNVQNISQELDDRGRNWLVFRVSEQKSIRIPVLRAAKLIWIYSCVKYMKEVQVLWNCRQHARSLLRTGSVEPLVLLG